MAGDWTLGGVVLRAPNAVKRGWVDSTADVTLAGGALRRYQRARLRTWSLSWDRLRPVDASAVLTAALAGGALTFVDPLLGLTTTVYANAPDDTPTPGTYDRRSLALDLTESDPST